MRQMTVSDARQITPPHIDTSQIPEVEIRNLCSTFLAAVKCFYEDPENLIRFEAWKHHRDEIKQK